MTDAEKYLFDVHGYLVIEGALSPEEVAAANAAVDRHADDIQIVQTILLMDPQHCEAQPDAVT